MNGVVRRGIVGRVAAVAATLVAAVVVPASPAHAAVACGDVITASVTLTADLSCTGDGLIVGASGITLDLGGHTIAGDGPGVDPVIDTGLKLNSVGNVTVKNGVVSDFELGFAVRFGSGNTITGVTVTHNLIGILVEGGTGHRILGNTATAQTADGIVVRDGSSHLVAGNTISGNPRAGLGLLDDNGSRIMNNLIIGNNLQVTGNAGKATLLAGNQVRNNAEFGILVAGSVGVHLQANSANFNGTDGIVVLSPTTKLTANIANNNGDDGIDAVAGVVNGGGNKASGNADQQCVNVACS